MEEEAIESQSIVAFIGAREEMDPLIQLVLFFVFLSSPLHIPAPYQHPFGNRGTHTFADHTYLHEN